jgi:arsenical pump membrane protein
VSARVVLAVAIFVGTLFLVLARPRGLHEGFGAAAGAAAMGAAGLVGLGDAVDVVTIAREPLLFLLALLLLSKLVERSGFFDWAAAHAARGARGRGDRLFRNLFVLGALTTVTLSLDTTALLVTPLVLACVRRLEAPPRPYVLACAFVANAASLLLPVSNLTNLLFVSRFGFTFGTYAARMIAPQLVAIVATYALLRRAVARDLRAFERFDPARCGEPGAAVPHRRFFLVTCVVLGATLVAYFVAPRFGVPAYAATFAACVALAVGSRGSKRVGAAILGEIAWGVFPFVIGLFVVVRGLENAGLAAAVAAATARIPPGGAWRALTLAAAGAVASNASNNLPAALFARTVLGTAGASPDDVAAMLVGLDVGPNVLVTASLATILVLAVARKAGAPVDARDLLRVGLRVTPIAVAVAAITIAAQALLGG